MNLRMLGLLFKDTFVGPLPVGGEAPTNNVNDE